VSTPGYFDEALRELAKLIGDKAVPEFNKEFQNTVKLAEHENLVVANGVGPITTRGHVTFRILGPGPKELKKLVEFFKSTRTPEAVWEKSRMMACESIALFLYTRHPQCSLS